MESMHHCGQLWQIKSRVLGNPKKFVHKISGALTQTPVLCFACEWCCLFYYSSASWCCFKTSSEEGSCSVPSPVKPAAFPSPVSRLPNLSNAGKETRRCLDFSAGKGRGPESYWSMPTLTAEESGSLLVTVCVWFNCTVPATDKRFR